MRALLLALTATALLGTVACTPKDNGGQAGTHGHINPHNQDHRGQPPYNPGQGGRPGYPGNGYGQGQNLPGDFEVLNMRVGQAAIKTVKAVAGTNRDDLETIRISCMDTTAQARNSSIDGIIIVDGSEMSLMGNQSRRKPHTYITCSDRNRRDDRWSRHFQGGERRLVMGQQTTVNVMTNKNRFRRDQMISLVVSCNESPIVAAAQGRQGISLTRGSKIIVNRDFRRSFGGGVVQFKIDAESVVSCN